MSYTKGEWKIEIVKSGKDEVYARIEGIAFTSGQKIGVYKRKLDKESLANAQLIAAAPDLLEACKFAKTHTSGQYWKAGQIIRGEDVAILMMIQDNLKQAIAKAENTS